MPFQPIVPSVAAAEEEEEAESRATATAAVRCRSRARQRWRSAPSLDRAFGLLSCLWCHLCLCLCLGFWSATGFLRVEAAVAVYSRSGQFIVHSANTSVPSLGRVPIPAQTNVVRLEPEPLLVTCERIRTAVFTALGQQDSAGSKVHVWLYPGRTPDNMAPVSATRYTDGYTYHVHLPEEAEPTALVRALVYVVLLEYSNRWPGTHSAEIPIWLVEGLTAELRSSSGPDLLAQSTPLLGKVGDGWGQVQSSTRLQQLALARSNLVERLRFAPRLAFSDLSLPSLESLSGPNLRNFRDHSNAFLIQLAGLPDGPACTASMLRGLTSTLNWQVAFQQAFRKHFSTWLDVEKWWAVAVTRLTGRNEASLMKAAGTLRRLEDILRVDVAIQNSPAEIPWQSTLTLQQLARDWGFSRQRPVLETKLSQLAALRVVAAAECLPLMDGYRTALETYLRSRPFASSDRMVRGANAVVREAVVRQVCERLENLDRRRRSMEAELGTLGISR